MAVQILPNKKTKILPKKKKERKKRKSVPQAVLELLLIGWWKFLSCELQRMESGRSQSVPESIDYLDPMMSYLQALFQSILYLVLYAILTHLVTRNLI